MGDKRQVKLFVDKKLVADDVSVADNFALRLKGLMFKGGMKEGEAFMIPRCNWIHTMFMNFPIDVVYLNSDYVIVDIEKGVRPWRMCAPRLRAAHILELFSGTAESRSLHLGEVVKCIA